MVAQLIISQEDSTSFFSMGSVQDDATLVSALGGALANFAVEMGLSDIGTTNANYSKFQNGVLITKGLNIANYRPSLMIAIRDFGELEQYHYMFLIDYGTLLANKIITKFEKMYSGSGQIPRFEDVIDIIPTVAYDIQRDSPNTLKEFTTHLEKSSSNLLEEIWENQGDKGQHPFKFRSYSYAKSKIEQIKSEFVKYYYKEGTNIDALFPLYFSASSDFKHVTKLIDDFLKKKSSDSTKKISDEIKRIIEQLAEMSSSRSRKGKVEVESVDLINADLLFERISVLKLSELHKERELILHELCTSLLQKLYQIYPLKYLSASFNKPIDLHFVNSIFSNTVEPMLDKIYTKSEERFVKQVSSIMRDITSKLKPDEVIKQKGDFLYKFQDRFIRSITKQDPFLILADKNLVKLREIASKFANESFEQFRTAHDEAMALWYIVRQIKTSLSKLKTTTQQTIIQLTFLQALVRQYQFRNIPKMVYELAKSLLTSFASTTKSKDPALVLLERNIKAIETELQFSIPSEIKFSIINQFKKVKTTQQSFTNIEELSFFSQAFSIALEVTIADILEDFFGSQKYPRPPKLLSETIEKIVLNSQGLFSTSKIIQAIVKQPGAQDLFSKDAESLLIKTLKFNNILPSLTEFARFAFESEWFIDKKSITKSENLKSFSKNFNPHVSKKDSSNLSDSKLLSRTVVIPSLGIEGTISDLIKDPAINAELWILFSVKAFVYRREQLKLHQIKLEKKMKTNAGATSGKKKLASSIKQVKTLIKAINQIISGGNILQKFFLRKKDLSKLLYSASKERFPGLNYYPENFVINADKGLIYGNKMYYQYSAIPGDFKRLTEIYASTWVKDSEYIKKLKEEILWNVLEKKAMKNLPLESRILSNLQKEATRGGRIDQETIVRNTIEQEASLQFRKAVRESIRLAFGTIREDMLIRIDKRTKENYIKIDEIDIDKKYLQPDYEKLNFIKILKISDEKVEIRMNVTNLLPVISSRKKKAHSIRIFVRDGLKEAFRTRHFKAFNILGELIEQYIGEQAADLFYSRSRMLEQLILESIDES